MGKLTNGRSFKALALLSITVPIGLLVAFRLAGVLRGPMAIAETITLGVNRKELERPYGPIDIGERLQSYYGVDISVNQSVYVDDYHHQAFRYGGSSYVSLLINVNASTAMGYVRDVNLLLHEDHEDSKLNFIDEDLMIQLENLSVTDLKDWAKEVSLNLTGVNRPHSGYYRVPVDWVLLGPDNQSHQLDITSEVVYFNGTVYKKIIQPFQLTLAPDNNNSFDTAQEIREGYYPKFLLGPEPDDTWDYYKINATQGQRVIVDFNGSLSVQSPFFVLHLYDPSGNLVAASERENNVQILDFVADSNGFWIIGVRIHGSFGFYSIGVNQ